RGVAAAGVPDGAGDETDERSNADIDAHLAQAVPGACKAGPGFELYSHRLKEQARTADDQSGKRTGLGPRILVSAAGAVLRASLCFDPSRRLARCRFANCNLSRFQMSRF